MFQKGQGFPLTRVTAISLLSAVSVVFYVTTFAASIFFLVSLWGSDVHTRHTFDVGGVPVSTVNAILIYGVISSTLGLSSSCRAYKEKKLHFWVVISIVGFCGPFLVLVLFGCFSKAG